MTQDAVMEQGSKFEEECYHCLIKEYVEQLEDCHINNKVIDATKLVNAVMRNPKETQVGKMGDAEELLRHIEDKLEI